MRKQSLLAVGISIVSLAVHAGAIEWPSDFWQQVTNGIAAAVQPVVQTSASKPGFSSRATEMATDVLGQAETPFDSRLEIFWCGSFLLDSSAPGLLLLLR